EHHRHDEPHPEDHHHEGHAAEELDVERGGQPDPPLRGEAADPDEDPEQEAEHDRGNGQAYGAAHEGPEAQEALDHQEREVAPDDVEVHYRVLLSVAGQSTPR